jgi:hypothetical protein
MNTSGYSIIFALGAAFASYAASAPASSNGELTLSGIWYPLESPAGVLPCSGPNSVAYTSDGTIIVKSQRQVLKGTYTAIQIGDGLFQVSVIYSVNNGEPNCQGLSPTFVVEHTPTAFTVERNGEQLRTCSIAVPAICFRSSSRRPGK